MKLLVFIVNMLVWSLAVGCVRAAESNIAGLNPGLVLSGEVINLAGDPQAGVLVYVEGGQTSAATTDTSGKFSLSFRSSDLALLKNKVPYSRQIFYLYFELNQAELDTAVSPAIELSERGQLSLETITLRPAVATSGTVHDLSVAGTVENCSDAGIRLGRVSTQTAADGTFSLQNVTAGIVPIIITKDGLKTYFGEIDTTTADFAQIMQQIVLFTQDVEVGGALLTVDPSISNAQGLSPLASLFNAQVTNQTRYVRLSTDQTALLGAGLNVASLPWQRVDQSISFQFSSVGGHVLYYQFTDIAQTTLSAIGQLIVNVDSFASSQGVQINSGALVVNDPNVTLTIDVPSSAVQMRMAESAAALGTSPWTNPATTLAYQFAPLSSSNDGNVQTRSMYVQFADALSNQSNVYGTQVTLALFTDISATTLVVGDGSGIVTVASPTITVTAPAGTNEIRMAEDPQQLLQLPWQQIQTSFPFLLSGVTEATTTHADCTVTATPSYQVTPGTHTLYYQFRNYAGYLSDVKSTSVTVSISSCIPLVITPGSII